MGRGGVQGHTRGGRRGLDKAPAHYHRDYQRAKAAGQGLQTSVQSAHRLLLRVHLGTAPCGPLVGVIYNYSTTLVSSPITKYFQGVATWRSGGPRKAVVRTGPTPPGAHLEQAAAEKVGVASGSFSAAAQAPGMRPARFRRLGARTVGSRWPP